MMVEDSSKSGIFLGKRPNKKNLNVNFFQIGLDPPPSPSKFKLLKSILIFCRFGKSLHIDFFGGRFSNAILMSFVI